LEHFGDILSRILPGSQVRNAEELLSRADSWEIRLALLCRECAPQQLSEILRRYALGLAASERILRMIRCKDTLLQNHAERCRVADLFGKEGVQEYLVFRRALHPDRIGERQIEELMALFQPGICYNTATLAVNGRMLQEAGIAPGPFLGTVLRHLTDAVIAGEMENCREQLLQRALDIYKEENKL
jgi:hypothetical protein